MAERLFSRKFSSNTKQVIAKVSPESKRQIKILMRISGDLNVQRQSQLQALGCQIRTVAGDVVSAELPEGALRRLGELEFINYIEISQPLYLEPKDKKPKL